MNQRTPIFECNLEEFFARYERAEHQFGKFGLYDSPQKHVVRMLGAVAKAAAELAKKGAEIKEVRVAVTRPPDPLDNLVFEVYIIPQWKLRRPQPADLATVIISQP